MKENQKETKKNYYNKKSENQVFTIYEESESDLKLITQFDTMQEVENYLKRDRKTIYKNIKNQCKIKLLKCYNYITDQETEETKKTPIYQDIRVIKDTF